MKHIITILLCFSFLTGFSQTKKENNLDTLNKNIIYKSINEDIIPEPSIFEHRSIMVIDYKDGSVLEFMLPRYQDIHMCFALTPWFILTAHYISR
jgi:hypothetical protein